MNMTNRQVALIIVFAFAAAFFVRYYRGSLHLNAPSDADQMTFGSNTPPFHVEWQHKHDVNPFECWTDEGYDPTLSDIPRDIQLLAGMDYGKADIDNGGFHQFFYNSTGRFAPEMVEWCERSGLKDVAAVIRQAMKILHDGEYPRSYDERRRALAKFPVQGERRQWDPFYQLDDKFFALLSHNGSRYDDAANKWLREVCGITQLDAPPVVRKMESTTAE